MHWNRGGDRKWKLERKLVGNDVIVLELAVYQATQYKFAIFFKNENRGETTLGVLILFMGSLIQQKIASAREALAMRGR